MDPSQILTGAQVIYLANANGYQPSSLNAVLSVESSGHGFSTVTNRIIIQFEPAWFKREYALWAEHANGSVWLNNGIGNQTEEWNAFNDAWKDDPTAAMLSTSIGLPQIMGFHYASLGFKSVGDMWDYAKVSEANQVSMLIKFLKANPVLDTALKNKDWPNFAKYYNGAGYLELAAKTNSIPYDQRMANADADYLKAA